MHHAAAAAGTLASGAAHYVAKRTGKWLAEKASHMVGRPSKHESKRRKRSHKAKNHSEKLEVLRNGLLSNHTKIRMHGRKGHHKLTPGKWELMFSYGGTLKSTEGTQNTTEMFYLNTISQASVSSGTSYNIQSAPASYFDLNPYQAGTSNFIGAVTGLTIPTKPKDDSVYAGMSSINLTISNTTTSMTHVELYFLVSKSTHSITPTMAWNNGYNDQSAGQTVTWGAPNNSSGTVSGTVISGYLTNGALYTKPTDSRQFKQFWTIKDVNAFTLDAQGTNQQTVSFMMDKKYEREFFANIASSTFHRGSFAIMMVIRGGQVIRDSSTSITLPNQICEAEVRWFAQIKTFCRGVPEAAARLNVNQGSFAYTNVAATIANQHVMNVVDVADTMKEE